MVQLERLHSEDTHRRLMITHTIESYWIPSQKKTKSKLQIKIIRQNFKFFKWALYVTHLLKLLDKMCKYEMDPMSIVEDTEQTRFCPQTDKVIPVYLPFNFVEGGGIINNIPALVQIMAWCWRGDKPLSEPMMVSLLTHI